ncbi:hypothetical protein FIBSPDRAFT_262004 [Athelia psychrophila]|uniref:Uncharacterized protein n=1 Tax=Athelia psychrophila TaxID=1759441 RepID=A0A165XET7_9AGAM|nr:hypothetical protein FIBSPDRAFT_262004 [Fibularhizoctonia sp. CBS 109695]
MRDVPCYGAIFAVHAFGLNMLSNSSSPHPRNLTTTSTSQDPHTMVFRRSTSPFRWTLDRRGTNLDGIAGKARALDGRQARQQLWRIRDVGGEEVVRISWRVSSWTPPRSAHVYISPFLLHTHPPTKPNRYGALPTTGLVSQNTANPIPTSSYVF